MHNLLPHLITKTTFIARINQWFVSSSVTPGKFIEGFDEDGVAEVGGTGRCRQATSVPALLAAGTTYLGSYHGV